METTSRYPQLDFKVQRGMVRYYAENVFSISEDHARKLFDNYFLLYWQGRHIIQEMKEGTITRDGIPYLVRFKSGLHRGKILRLPDEQFALSFRNPAHCFQLPALVLVKIPRGSYV